MYEGRERLGWGDLPVVMVTLIPALWNPAIERGDSEALFWLLERVQPMRSGGITISTSWQLFDVNGEAATEEFPIEVPNEITLGQLTTNFIGPRMSLDLDLRTNFNWRTI
jgi:hypothetical protein